MLLEQIECEEETQNLEMQGSFILHVERWYRILVELVRIRSQWAARLVQEVENHFMRGTVDPLSPSLSRLLSLSPST